VSRSVAQQPSEVPAETAGTQLFHHDVRRDARKIITFRGVASNGAVVVETEVYPLGDDLEAEPLRRPFPFPTPLQANRFVDEALVALEYLGCSVT
jgi:hypothetical protein